MHVFSFFQETVVGIKRHPGGMKSPRLVGNVFRSGGTHTMYIDTYILCMFGIQTIFELSNATKKKIERERDEKEIKIK